MTRRKQQKPEKVIDVMEEMFIEDSELINHPSSLPKLESIKNDFNSLDSLKYSSTILTMPKSQPSHDTFQSAYETLLRGIKEREINKKIANETNSLNKNKRKIRFIEDKFWALTNGANVNKEQEKKNGEFVVPTLSNIPSKVVNGIDKIDGDKAKVLDLRLTKDKNIETPPANKIARTDDKGNQDNGSFIYNTNNFVNGNLLGKLSSLVTNVGDTPNLSYFMNQSNGIGKAEDPTAIFTCLQCSEKFQTMQQLVKHMEKTLHYNQVYNPFRAMLEAGAFGMFPQFFGPQF
ncbi:Zinc finger, C2H2 domain and Zinc finger C2H2-type/integrase DNA-binding domain-containing protein [Strongyloides ratti]|uniref:Zinc finger, C2H2 domain and Zinc finger C2H2-type/integrase DNA-binding domain-containing protein n=1 Tax=Strongyloides ratti TaxID=34506 RepID=A0A090L930_STRRB|nr:Zinc finger, C2H2 domain and Zinc finger C2H2-type/integrase DNA-binding domain-containing protein [Strongyloides ratti]CEF64035.1 Zinc finger, C2H2 domain and Zinc finger C2H2-type/integrase DNA-binding domain-containing protein [Strongyloides ratti]